MNTITTEDIKELIAQVEIEEGLTDRVRVAQSLLGQALNCIYIESGSKVAVAILAEIYDLLSD